MTLQTRLPPSASAGNAPPRQDITACAIAAVLGGLAGGIAWCFVSLSLGYDGAALFVPIGLLLGLFLRWQGFQGRHAMLGSAAATLLAFWYAQWLFAAVRIAALLELPLRETLFSSGLELTAQVAWANLHRADWLALGLAIAAGGGVAAWRLPIRG